MHRVVASVDEQLIEQLRARGMRVTTQRLLIHRLLREQPGHLSAEDVRERLGERLPGVSAQTVYGTLQLLADLGVVRRVAVPGAAARFEQRLDEHHHTVCDVCGAVQDIDAPLDMEAALAAARANRFAPTAAGVVVVGRCAACHARR